jgi:AMP nucleosidase
MSTSVPLTQAPFHPPKALRNAGDALALIQQLYTEATQHLQAQFALWAKGSAQGQARACYPLVRIRVDRVTSASQKSSASFGAVEGTGTFEATITRPDLFGRYLLEQLELLLANHDAPLEVGTSAQPIPIHFALAESQHAEGGLTPAQRIQMRESFDVPDLGAMNDDIANGLLVRGRAQPLALFNAPRVDYSLHRLRHYCGTGTQHFQSHILLTNYAFYVDEFIALAQAAMRDPSSEYVCFVEPGNRITQRVKVAGEAPVTDGKEPPRLPQMPAYHLVREDGSGVTMVNIGVGPANAKNITDHLAVLRPNCWLMLGHCAGLRNSQALGDYVLAHGYARDDHVLDAELPLWVPIPALAEIQIALQRAVADVAQLPGPELKRLMRTGTVATTDNRNWELLGMEALTQRFNQSRAIALDMESATIAANGFRFRVPYGTLLCVSDKPLHGELKLPGMADQFYRDRVDQHLRIGMRAVELLRELGSAQLHSRKLRSFAEVAFR